MIYNLFLPQVISVWKIKPVEDCKYKSDNNKKGGGETNISLQNINAFLD